MKTSIVEAFRLLPLWGIVNAVRSVIIANTYLSVCAYVFFLFEKCLRLNSRWDSYWVKVSRCRVPWAGPCEFIILVGVR